MSRRRKGSNRSQEMKATSVSEHDALLPPVANESKEESLLRRFREPLLALLGVLIFLGLGTLAFSLTDGWSVLDSVYFCTTVLTTVGYGTPSPSTVAGKSLTIVYILLSVGGVIFLLGLLVDSLVEKEHHSLMSDMAEAERGEQPRGQPHWLSLEGRRVLMALLTIIGVVGIGVFVYYFLEPEWSVFDAFYFVVVTVSTTGFGDYSPSHTASRAFSIPYLLIGTVVFTGAMAQFAGAFVDRRSRLRRQTLLRANLERRNLAQLDLNGDGKVDREEYLRVKLIELGLVQAQDLAEIDRRFTQLDRSHTGYLDSRDLS